MIIIILQIGGVVLCSQAITACLTAPAFQWLGGREGRRDDLPKNKKEKNKTNIAKL